MATALDFITEAMQDIGALAIEEAPSNAEAQLCLSKLNSMIETWNTESTMIYNVSPLVFPLVAGQRVYTLGTGGDFNTARPVMIQDVSIRDTNSVDLPCRMASEQEYAAIITKTISSGFPIYVYDDGDFPLKNLAFWPVPGNSAYSVVLWEWLPISSTLVLTDTITLPPGYKRALISNLCVEIAPAFGATISQELGAVAITSKQAIERLNYTIRELGIDGAIPRRRTNGSAFAWYTGPYS